MCFRLFLPGSISGGEKRNVSRYVRDRKMRCRTENPPKCISLQDLQRPSSFIEFKIQNIYIAHIIIAKGTRYFGTVIIFQFERLYLEGFRSRAKNESKKRNRDGGSAIVNAKENPASLYRIILPPARKYETILPAQPRLVISELEIN